MNLKKEVTKMGKELGLDLNFTPDKVLKGFKRGEPLTMGELKEAAKTKAIVWVFYQEYDARRPRINSAHYVEIENGQFFFTDGTCGSSEMDIGPDNAPAGDDASHTGDFKVFAAVKK